MNLIAKASAAIEEMEAKGLSIHRLPPSVIESVLTYPELSDMLDAVVLDMAKFAPELFDNTMPRFTTPGRLKGYLYLLAIYHLQQAGVLVNAGGVAFPDCAGATCPIPLAAWLQFIGVYHEGDSVGKAKYVVPAAIPVVGNENLVVGTPAETAISNSTFLPLNAITISTSLGEAAGVANTTNSATVLALWQTDGDIIANLIDACGYPKLPMWSKPPTVPDGSFFGFPTNGTTGLGSTAAPPWFTSPFVNWDHEIAALYYTTASINATAISGFSLDLRMAVMAAEWPMTPAGTTYDDPYWIRKQGFCFILRNNRYSAGASSKSLRVYQGDQLKTFVINPVPLSTDGYHTAVAFAVQQLANQTQYYDAIHVWAATLVHSIALVRKLALNSIGALNASGYAFTQRYFAPTSVDGLNLIAPVTQLLNDMGPVVREGQLCVPTAYAASINWYSVSVSSYAAFPDSLFQSRVFSSVGTTAFTWTGGNGAGAQTLNATWISAYAALPQVFAVPWVASGQLQSMLNEFISQGQADARGEILYPVSKGPRGGFSLLTMGATKPMILTSNNLTLNVTALQALYSPVPIVGPEITMAAVARWRFYSSLWIPVMKFVKMIDAIGGDTFTQRYMEIAMSPNGTVTNILTKAFEERHMKHNDALGVISSNENIDACLWDALKSVAGTIAGYIQPVASKAAQFGCGAIPVVGTLAGPLCGAAASALISHVADGSATSTNRNQQGGFASKIKSVFKTAKSEKRIQMGELPVDRGGGASMLQPAVTRAITSSKDRDIEAAYLRGSEDGHKLARAGYTKRRPRKRKARAQQQPQQQAQAYARYKPNGKPRGRRGRGRGRKAFKPIPKGRKFSVARN